MKTEIQSLITQSQSEEDGDKDHDKEQPHLETEREVLLPPRIHSHSSIICKEPKDRLHAVYGIFLFLGVATLLPWNFFITAKSYFDFKFRNTSLPDDIAGSAAHHNSTTQLQTHFESYLSISSMLSNLIFISLAMLTVRNVSLNSRMISSLVPVIALFVITVIFTNVNTDSWQEGFFWFTLMSSAFMVGLTAVLTGSVFGLSCLFPPKYTQAVMTGQALGGTLSALVNIGATAIGGSPQKSAFAFFLIATICLVLALCAYFSLYYMKFSKFFISNQDKLRVPLCDQNKVHPMNTDQANDIDKKVYEVNVEIPHSREMTTKRHFFSSILKKIWPYFLSVCLVFLVTLATFPAVVSLIRSVQHSPKDWTEIYFSPVVCFLLFNLCDLIGRTSTHWVRWPRNGQKCCLLSLALLRVAFLPLFMLCNTQSAKEKSLPVLLNDDAWPIVLSIGLGLSNGYIGTLSMLYGPVNVDIDEAEGAGMVMTFGMVLGLALGSLLSLLLVSHI